jgi:Kef-type K+ transport system membrane component KefB
MNTTELFLVAMVIILTVPFLIWRLGRTEHFAPLVVVQIVTGVILGPGAFGHVFPDLYNTVFTPAVITALNGVAWWAVSLFVFLAGIELDLKKFLENKKETITTAGLALGMPLVICSLAGVFLLQFPGWMGDRAAPWQFVLGIGMASAVTALPILILFMQKLDILRKPLGQRILRYASLDDIAIWGVLALILMDWQRVTNQIIFLVLFVGVAWQLRRLLPKLMASDRIYVSLIWLCLVALGADWCGLHFMVGAFIAGAVIDKHLFQEQFLDPMRDNVLLLIMPVFFLSTGLRTNWQMGGEVVVAVALLMFVAQFVSKYTGIWIAGKILNWQPGEVKLIAWLLQTKALIEIIFVNVLLDKGIITSEMFTAMLLMAILSTMATIPMVTKLKKQYPQLT